MADPASTAHHQAGRLSRLAPEGLRMRGQNALAQPYELLAWSLPFIVFELIRHPNYVKPSTAIVVVMLALILPAIVRRPGPALVVLVWFVSLQYVGLAWLYQLGFPEVIVRQASALKELLAISVLIAAGREVMSGRRRLDSLDKLVLAFAAALLGYLFFPTIATAGATPVSFGNRLLGYRLDAGYLLLFVAARHAPITATWRRRFVASLIAVTAVVAAFGIYEWITPAGYQNFVVNQLGLLTYSTDVLNTPATDVNQIVTWMTLHPTRVASVFGGPFDLADYLLIAGGVLLERVVRKGVAARDLLVLAVVGLALYSTQTRANLVALAFMAVLIVVPGRGRVLWNRLRIGALVVLVVLAMAPSIAGSRLGGAANSAGSTQGHINEIRSGIDQMNRQPLGTGLGTAPAVAVRDLNQPLLISDNSILQVGDELGVLMVVPWLAIIVLTLVGLSRAIRDGDDPHLAAGARLALVGLLVAGQGHHAFQVFAVVWPLWALIGLGVSGTEVRPRRFGPPTSATSADPPGVAQVRFTDLKTST